MAEFNPIDNDFACPAICALTTMLTGPRTCMKNMLAGTCVHPVASEADQIALEIGALTTEQSMRVFSSVFQQEVFIATATKDGETIYALAIHDDDGNIKPISEPALLLEDEDMQLLQEIRDLPEYQGGEQL